MVGALEEPNDVVVLLPAVLVDDGCFELAKRLAAKRVNRKVVDLFN